MKIYINGRFLSQKVTGVQRYAREIVSAIDKKLWEENVDDEWCILAPHNIKNDLQVKKIKLKICGSWIGHAWEQIELPFYAKDGFLINLCNCAPIIKKNQLVAIHDAAVMTFPKSYSWQFRTWYRIIYAICGKRADKIVTVSKFSKNELNKYFNIDKKKIKVVYNGLEHMERINEDKSIIKKMKLQEERFVLAVSSQNPTKNFAMIIKAAKKMPTVRFIIVGGSNERVFSRFNKEKVTNITYTGYISDEELVSLYRNARVFVYPSLYEGFGIPPLEALSQGCPIVVSNCASLPEVCGNYAEYCKVDDVDSLIDMIKVHLKNDNNRRVEIDGLREKYSWIKAGELIKEYIIR